MRRDSRAGRERFEDLPAEVAYDHAVDKAMKLLATRSRSRSEVTARLKRTGFSQEVVSMVETRLIELDILNDQTFAWEVIESCLARGIAPARIRVELRLKGVDQAVADAVWAAAVRPEEDRERAIQLAHRRARAYGRLAPEVAHRRLAGFLAHKGYDSDIVQSVCREVIAIPEEPGID